MGALVQTMILILMELISCDLFVSMFFEKRDKQNKWKTISLWGLVCLVGILSTKLLGQYFVLKIIASLCVLVMAMLIMYQERLIKIILACMGYYGTMIACDLVIMIVIERVLIWRWTSSLYGDIYVTLVAVLAKTIEFILFAWVKRRFSKYEEFYQLDTKVWYRFVISSFFTIIILFFLIIDIKSGNLTRLIIGFGMLLLNILFYYSMWNIVKSERKNREYFLMQEKAKGQIALYNHMEKAFLEQQGSAHEFKNHMVCVQGLLEENSVEVALNYIKEITDKIMTRDTFAKTGNSIIDIILSQKYHEAKQNNITFVTILDRLDGLPMSETDTAILLSNLLNNALEACMKIERLEDRIIKIKFFKKENSYFLKIANKVNEPVNIVDQVAITTKSDKEMHGIGMRNIREIIEKYNAEGLCEYVDGWFEYTIVVSNL